MEGGGGREGGQGLISGWANIRNNIFVDKWMGLYLGEGGGLKTRGALNWDFTVVELEFI